MYGRIADRFGWTFSELFDEDESIVLKAIQMMNITDALRRVNSAIEKHQPDAIPPGDYAIWKMVNDAEKEDIDD